MTRDGLAPCRADCRHRCRRSRGSRSTCAGSGTTRPTGCGKRCNAEVWQQTRNPVLVIQNTPRSRLEELARDREFVERVRQLDRQRSRVPVAPGWFQQTLPARPAAAHRVLQHGVRPHRRAAAVLRRPRRARRRPPQDGERPRRARWSAVGLFYREGYFRQMLDARGRAARDLRGQLARVAAGAAGAPTPRACRCGSRSSCPGATCASASGRRASAACDALPARQRRPAQLAVRPRHHREALRRRRRGAAAAGDRARRRRLARARGARPRGRGLPPQRRPRGARHHRARALASSHAQRHCDFFTALWATRAGNVFTTHTPVAAAFDTFPRAAARRSTALDYARQLRPAARPAARARPRQPATTATSRSTWRTSRRADCARINGVSELHGRVSRRIFAPLFPRWPEPEVPVEPRHQRRARAVVGLAVGRPPVDRGLRQGALARRRSSGSRDAVAPLSDAQTLGLPRHGAPRPGATTRGGRLQRQLSQRGDADEVVARHRRRARPERADARLRAPLHRVQAARPCCSASPSGWCGC